MRGRVRHTEVLVRLVQLGHVASELFHLAFCHFLLRLAALDDAVLFACLFLLGISIQYPKDSNKSLQLRLLQYAAVDHNGRGITSSGTV